MQFKSLILPLLLALILILSTFGIILNSSQDNTNTETIEYKEYIYTQIPQGWKVKKDSITVLFHYTPQELADMPNITSIISLVSLQQSRKIYVANSPLHDTSLAEAAFQGGIQPLLSTQVIPACWEDGKGCENKPLKSCKDATSSEKIVEFRLVNASKTSVTYENSCLIVSTAPETALQATEALLFRLLELGP